AEPEEPSTQDESATQEDSAPARERSQTASLAETIATAADEVRAEDTVSRDAEAEAPAPDAEARDSVSPAEPETPAASAASVASAARQRSADIPRNTAPVTQPPTLDPVRYTPPRYPESARRRGLTGTVIVEATVGRRGRVVSVRIVDSSGVESLDRAATRAVNTWRFAGSAQNQTSLHRIRFDLEDTP
ncbi:MAG: energy transducer TonB, partial [Alkalispirochaeta sp.]